MNNNRGNNRRRGRGNNRQQGGRGEQLNRIDSRARGNAPQLLEKYRKLAQDAHLNGDRVTAEYYLQFADHYFRVIADTRQRQDERQRRDDRLPEDESDEFDYTEHSDFPSFDQPARYRREERRPLREETAESESGGVDDEAAYDSAGPNPFTRDNRVVRGLQPRRDRSERRSEAADPRPPEEQHGIDPAVLPPAIEGTPGNEGEAIAPLEAVPASAPRRRGRRPKASDDDAGPLEAVNG